MADLIDRKHFDKALEDVLVVASGKLALGKEPKIVSKLTLDYISQVRKWLSEEPAVEAEPAVHAHWKENPGMSDIYRKYYQCSNCRRTVSLFAGRPEDFFPYCHCGAKMDEEVPV